MLVHTSWGHHRVYVRLRCTRSHLRKLETRTETQRTIVSGESHSDRGENVTIRTVRVE